MLNETCPIGSSEERRGCTHHGDRPARECTLRRANATFTCGLHAAPAAAHAGDRPELMARAVGPRTPAGAKGVVRAAMGASASRATRSG